MSMDGAEETIKLFRVLVHPQIGEVMWVGGRTHLL
jgi:hypothetical protein